MGVLGSRQISPKYLSILKANKYGYTEFGVFFLNMLSLGSLAKVHRPKPVYLPIAFRAAVTVASLFLA